MFLRFKFLPLTGSNFIRRCDQQHIAGLDPAEAMDLAQERPALDEPVVGIQHQGAPRVRHRQLALLALFDAASPWVWPAWLAWLGAAYLRWHHRFIAGLAMGCLSLIAVILAALGKWMEPDMNGFLLLSLIAIGLSVTAARWLQQQRRQHV